MLQETDLRPCAGRCPGPQLRSGRRKDIITSIGRWIGNARRRFAQLTNFREDELYNWLITHKGYGNTKAQVNSEKQFLDRLASSGINMLNPNKTAINAKRRSKMERLKRSGRDRRRPANPHKHYP